MTMQCSNYEMNTPSFELKTSKLSIYTLTIKPIRLLYLEPICTYKINR